MSVNLVFFAAYMDRVSWKPAGEGRKYGDLSMKVTLPNVTVTLRGGQPFVIGDQSMWMKINVPKEKDGSSNNRKVDGFVGHANAGAKGVLVTGGIMSHWTDKPDKREVRVSFNEVSLSRENQPALNHVVIQGRVKRQIQGPSGLMNWVTVEDRYLNPFEKDKDKAWKSRFIEVWSPMPLPSCQEKDVLVLGNLSVHALAGQPDGTIRTQPYLHVVAREFHVCPSS